MKEKKVKKIVRQKLQPITNFLSTGCTILDLALADKLPGGFAGGRASHVYGWESSAKTVLAQEPLGSAQRQGGLIWFLDAEQTLDLERAKNLFGIDTDSKTFHYGVPETIEGLFDNHIAEAIKEIHEKEMTDKPNVVALDSLSALPTVAEKEVDLEKGTYGMTRAKQISTAYRKYLRALNDANLALVMINQARVNVNARFGDKMTVSGGKAIDFYASVSVSMSNIGKIKNARKMVIGNEFKFKVTKNKIAPPHRTGTFSLLYEYGIDDVRTNLQWLRELRDEKGNYTFGTLEYKALDDIVKAIENDNLEVALQEEVVKEWRLLYPPLDRKPRVR